MKKLTDFLYALWVFVLFTIFIVMSSLIIGQTIPIGY